MNRKTKRNNMNTKHKIGLVAIGSTNRESRWTEVQYGTLASANRAFHAELRHAARSLRLLVIVDRPAPTRHTLAPHEAREHISPRQRSKLKRFVAARVCLAGGKPVVVLDSNGVFANA